MRGKIPHIVQYQGSKRKLASQILQYVPEKFSRLIEPFSGVAAVSIAATSENRAERYIVNDINAPLIGMLREAIEEPEQLIDEYNKLIEISGEESAQETIKRILRDHLH